MSPSQALKSITAKVVVIEESISKIDDLLEKANELNKKEFLLEIIGKFGLFCIFLNDQNVDQECINDMAIYLTGSLVCEKERLETLLSEMTEPLNVAQTIEDLTKPEAEPVLPDFD